MKIGIFAGTFDPIHNGHVAFAQAALTEASLDKVVLVAEKEPYRKKPHASWDHRQAMVERATEDLEQVDHDYHFAAQLAHQHTMKDMLEVARQHYGDEHEIWFLVGSDLFEHMHQWHDIVEAKNYGGFVVALRHDHDHAWLNEKLALIKTQALIPQVVIVQNLQPKLASTQIRQAVLERKRSIDTPAGVTDYILEHDLYLKTQ